MNVITGYLPYWPIFAACGFFFVYAVIYFLRSRSVLRAHPGGLQWVREYGQPGFDLSRSALTFQKPDALCGFGIAVFALLISAGYALVKSYCYTGSWMSSFFTVYTLATVLAGTAGAIAVWLIALHLSKNNLAAMAAGFLFSVSCIRLHTTISVLAVSLLFLLRWFATEEDKPLFPRELLYYLSIFALTVGVICSPSVLWLVPLYMLLHVYRSVTRLHNRRGQLTASLLVAVAAWLLCAPLWMLGNGAIMYGLQFLRKLGSFLTDAQFYKLQLNLLRASLHFMVKKPSLSMVLPAMIDAPVLFAGAAGLLTAILSMVRRRKAGALAIVLLTSVLFVIWALSGYYLLTLPLVFAYACICAIFAESGKKTSAIVFTVIACAYYVAVYVLGHLLPLYREILIRLI